MKKTLALIFLSTLAFLSKAQIEVRGVDSVRIGNSSGNKSVGIYGRTYLKNTVLGSLNDSVLVRTSTGMIKMIPRTGLISGLIMPYAPIAGSAHYVQINPILQQTGNIILNGNISGSHFIGTEGHFGENFSGNHGVLIEGGMPSPVTDLLKITRSGIYKTLASDLSSLTASSSGWQFSRNSINLLKINGDGSVQIGNLPAGAVSDSLVVSDASGNLRKVNKNTISSNWASLIGIPSTITNFASSGSVNYAANAGSITWTNVYGRPTSLSSFTNDPGYLIASGTIANATTAANVAWANVSGKPTSLSNFTNDPGYLTASGTIANATTAANVAWANVSGKPTSLSNFTNDPGYLTASGTIANATTAANVAWNNVSGRPTSLSSFTNQPGYLTASGTIANAITAANVAWSNVSGRPTSLNSFTNDPGYVTSSGSVNYANSSGSVAWGNVSGRPTALSSFTNDLSSVPRAGGTNNFYSTSHPNDFYLRNDWDGARWNVTSNHGAPVRVGWADGAGTAGSVAWGNVSGRPTALSSFTNDLSSVPRAGGTNNFYSTSHPNDFYLRNDWDGARWNVTSNHGAPVRVGWADGAGTAGSVAWGNVSGRPTALSSFTNDPGYVTAAGSVNYANSAGSVNWNNVSGRPTDLNQFGNASGFVTSGGTVQNAVYATNAGSAGYANQAGNVDWSGITSRPTFNFATITASGSDTPDNIYLYKGASDGVQEGSSLVFNSNSGGSPNYSQVWQMGANGDLVNFSYTYQHGYWMQNARLSNYYGDMWIRGGLTQYSDSRIKENIVEMGSVAAKLRALRAVSYDRKDTKAHDIGFIAQELQAQFPELVKEGVDKEKLLGVNYSTFVAPLLKGWQEHDETIESQKKKIAAQQIEIDQLKKDMSDLKDLVKSLSNKQ